MIQFGTGGWRAIIGDEFIRENIEKVAAAMALLQKEEKKDHHGVVIGYDKRFLSDKASRWIAEVFAGHGIAVNYIEKVSPTPLIMYTVKAFACDYGMAVTASHNPADYNGIKIFTKGGKDADLSVTEKLEKIIEKLQEEDLKKLPFEEAVTKGIIRLVSPFNDYVDTIISMLDKEKIRNSELKILLDPMFGVSKAALQTVLITMRCEVDVINDRHDTSFGGRMPSPSEETLGKLRDMVKTGRYDLGIGTDGDADRLGIIDEEGNYVTANDIMSLLYYYLLKYKGMKGPVVRNISTTHLLDKIAESFQQKAYEVPVGFKHISSKMMDTGAIIGGESSGGLTIEGHIKGKDGIFAAALLVEMISVTGKRIHELLTHLQELYGTFFMHEENMALTKEKEGALKGRLFAEKELPTPYKEVEKVSYEDGLKIYYTDGGWLVARFSGTEKLLRVFTEGSTKREAKNTAEAFLSHFDLLS